MSLKRNSDDVEEFQSKHSKIEITQFTKFSILAPECRHHLLSYLTKPGLYQYAQLSNHCNLEIQMFNTTAPAEIALKDVEDGVLVTLTYRGQDYIRCDPVTKTVIDTSRVLERKFTQSPTMMKEIQEYLLKSYKYVKNKGPDDLEETFLKYDRNDNLIIDMRIWPMEVMTIKQIANVGHYTVTMYKSMYDDFIAYCNTIESSKDFNLLDCDEPEEKVTIPPEFFKTSLFKKCKHARFAVLCHIDDNDFINAEYASLQIKSSVSFDAIRQKVEQIRDDPTMKYRMIKITLPDDDTRELSFSNILAGGDFEGHGHYGGYRIGKAFLRYPIAGTIRVIEINRLINY